MDLQSNVNELITLRTNGVEDAMQSMKDIEALFDKVTSNYRPLLNGERYLSDVEVSHRLKVSRRTLQEYRDSGISSCVQVMKKAIVQLSLFRDFFDKRSGKPITCAVL